MTTSCQDSSASTEVPAAVASSGSTRERLLACIADRLGHAGLQPEIAATVYGTTTHPNFDWLEFAAAVDHLRNTLDTDTFETCIRTGAAMTLTEAVHYAHLHLQLARQHQP